MLRRLLVVCYGISDNVGYLFERHIGATYGAGSDSPSGAPEIIHGFRSGSCCYSFFVMYGILSFVI